MTRAADIIQALIARSPGRPLVERRTGLPYGWALWLRAQPPASPRPHAGPDDVARLLAQRPPGPPPHAEEMTPWAAFVSLWRQGWHRPPRDERPLRWGSGAGSLVLHVLFVIALAWIAWLQSLMPPPPP
ncbi:MAG TPA: hypothetical protein VFF91_12180, partial [Pseudoxanthomonas sp.]|nr:hypothetical protein [Pseudoxanthomonas sp.]